MLKRNKQEIYEAVAHGNEDGIMNKKWLQTRTFINKFLTSNRQKYEK